MTENVWQGAALIRPGILAFSGSIGRTDTHAHHAVQIMTASTPLTVVDERGDRQRGTDIVVPADTPHRIEAGAGVGTVVFLDPDTAAGRAAHQRCRDVGWTGGPPLARPDHPDDSLAAVITNLLLVLLPGDDVATRQARHPAVTAAQNLLPTLIAQGPVRTSDLAHRVGISASRLTHLFSDQVGLPVRRYVLWIRLSIAITRVAAGDDLTAAAHAAGFSDSAHLTRTCREIFGLPPSALSRHVHWDIEPTP
ncbi:helix-turn-helix transcriptional regulator [Rhodococcus ruber]|uniref:Helix-turn-helix-domain containing protein, AraC type n=1 Tax=Rhodococcus ruber TaxID=1830 RepID=A0A098BMT1_9NOCA|nr:AraC family transcriptional regulator [Rhodococcus ruber]MCD2127227.1 helix-turn-helix transcriptional regulator [Rhodococcus ruber]MCZ4503176.1 helix-turn-helix transcriptional regulator [Rhodococcus ruber]MCZ4530729.1 helix-turn-helix transcriptional regulator [Rhodococcus ruber]MCZ4621571.1 helix-turn-helix transcriptional regulator [Rhodococcus ruber]MDI9969455.1 helix-turn-helix transcriptional regulator [Rhodococcus ruber]